MNQRPHFGFISLLPGVRAALSFSTGWLLGEGMVQGQSPRTATAEATVVDGFVLGLTLTDGGVGYGEAPAVSLAGGGGRGASAVATVRNGVVDRLLVVDTGSGYSSTPAVVIAVPKEPLLESVESGIALRIRGQVGTTHQIMATDGLAPHPWTVRANVVVASSPYEWVDDGATPVARYYQVAASDGAPVIESAGVMQRLRIRGVVGTTNRILVANGPDWYPWRVLTNVVVAGSSYELVDRSGSTLQRSYRVSASETVAVEMDPGRWVWIPPGRFRMGSPASERNRRDDEGPLTVVTLTRGFWMGRYEVTQREYQVVTARNPSSFTGDLDRPVEQVNWYDATNYCWGLTIRERAAGRLPAGYEYRLPTEAQWEYVCRAGTTSRFSFGSALECDDLCGACPVANPYMWWCGNSGQATHPGGRKLPNPWGLHDMHGNVREWCADWWSDPLPGGRVADPTGASLGTDRVVRGGSWYDTSQYCRSAVRNYAWPRGSDHSLGLRAALVAVP